MSREPEQLSLPFAPEPLMGIQAIMREAPKGTFYVGLSSRVRLRWTGREWVRIQ